MPLSTETKFSFGKRSRSPEVIRLRMTLALLMNIMVPPTASFASGCSEGHGVSPYQLIVLSLAPMWKFTGSPLSLHSSHRGRPVFAAQVLHPVELRIGVDVDAPHSHGVAALRLLDGEVDVPPGKQGHGKKPAARIGLHLRHGVVEDPRADQAQVGVDGLAFRRAHRCATLAREPHDVWIDDLGPDAVLVHELETFFCPRASRVDLVHLPVRELNSGSLAAVAVDHARSRADAHRWTST